MLTSIGKWIAAKTVRNSIGVSIFIDNNGKWLIEGIRCAKQKDGELIVEEKHSYDQLDELVSWLSVNKGLPIGVQLDGKSILSRFIPVSGDSEKDASWLLKQVVPTGKPDEFLVNANKIASGYIVAVARVDVVNAVIDALSEHDIQPTGLFIGLPAYFGLHAYFKGEGELADFGHYTFTFSSGEIDSIKRNGVVENNFENEYDLSHNQVPAFAVASGYFTSSEPDYANSPVELDADQFFDQVLYKKLVLGLPVIVLLLLLVNTFIFFNADSEHAILMEEAAGNQLMYKTYQEKQRQYDQKKVTLEQLEGKNNAFAIVSDKIGSAVVSGITLDQLQIYPLVEKGRERYFDNRKLRISGESSDAKVFGKFIDRLESIDLIQEISYQDYSFNNRSGKGIFEIEVLTGELE